MYRPITIGHLSALGDLKMYKKHYAEHILLNVKNFISINSLILFHITLRNWIHNDHKENMNK